MDIITDPDIVLSSRLNPDITMALVSAQATQIRRLWWLYGPKTPTWSQVADYSLGILRAFSSNWSHEHPPLRPKLLLGHVPIHGLKQ